jgi:hypothetical protein
MAKVSVSRRGIKIGRKWELPEIVAGAVGLFFGLQGIWAFVAPRSWFDALATFEPYNKHFIHDIGTFQIGLGVAGVLAALRLKPLIVGLGALSAFQVLHVLSHVIDRDAGGRPGFDIPALGVFAALTVVALVMAARR